MDFFMLEFCSFFTHYIALKRRCELLQDLYLHKCPDFVSSRQLHYTEAVFKEKLGVWDPLPELFKIHLIS
jgi:hypothetical protein